MPPLAIPVLGEEPAAYGGSFALFQRTGPPTDRRGEPVQSMMTRLGRNPQEGLRYKSVGQAPIRSCTGPMAK